MIDEVSYPSTPPRSVLCRLLCGHTAPAPAEEEETSMCNVNVQVLNNMNIF